MENKQHLFRPISGYSKAMNSPSPILQNKENTENIVTSPSLLPTRLMERAASKTPLQSLRKKEAEVYCENLTASIDDSVYSAISFDSFKSTSSAESENRPNIPESVFLMKSFSMDEFNQARNITPRSSSSLALPVAHRVYAWGRNVNSPTDKQFDSVSPQKALKRKYKSRSEEEFQLCDSSIENC